MPRSLISHQSFCPGHSSLITLLALVTRHSSLVLPRSLVTLLTPQVEDLIEVGHEMNPSISSFDASCFNGEYITGDIDDAYLARLEKKGRGAGRNRPGQSTTLLGSGSGSSSGSNGSSAAAAVGAKQAAAV